MDNTNRLYWTLAASDMSRQYGVPPVDMLQHRRVYVLVLHAVATCAPHPTQRHQSTLLVWHLYLRCTRRTLPSIAESWQDMYLIEQSVSKAQRTHATIYWFRVWDCYLPDSCSSCRIRTPVILHWHQQRHQLQAHLIHKYSVHRHAHTRTRTQDTQPTAHPPSQTGYTRWCTSLPRHALKQKKKIKKKNRTSRNRCGTSGSLGLQQLGGFP